MLIVRPLKLNDIELLRQATFHNLNWNGNRFSIQEIDENPHFSHYYQDWKQNSDFGFVAERQGSPLGVVWLKYFQGTDRGYGFVNETIPELSVCVFPESRRLGIGTMLMNKSIEEAKRLFISAISLSVETGNPARNLYLQLGFKPINKLSDNGTLILNL